MAPAARLDVRMTTTTFDDIVNLIAWGRGRLWSRSCTHSGTLGPCWPALLGTAWCQ